MILNNGANLGRVPRQAVSISTGGRFAVPPAFGNPVDWKGC
jgi:hypothetical protein